MASWIVRASFLVATALTATACGGILGIDYLANDLDAGTDATNGPDSEAIEAAARYDATPNDASVSFDQASADVRDERGADAQDSTAANDVGADRGGPVDSAVEGGPIDAPIDGRSDASVCSAPCPVGQSRCGTGVVETCQLQANGCAAWISSVTCGPHQACSTTRTTASCACDATMCTQRGTVCQDSQTKATCATDASGCLYVSATLTCAAPMTCSGAAPGATCTLTCMDSCTQGQKACVSGSLSVCTLGANGCWAYGPATPCGQRQSCTGAAGTATCTCKTDPVCSGVGNTCLSASTAATCAQDALGCLYEAASRVCTNQACVSGACAGTCTPGTSSSCAACHVCGQAGSCDPVADGTLCGGIGKVCANGFCCGDGHVEPGEQCDLGAANAPNAYGRGTCTTQCKAGGYCGDGIVNGPEACDSGGSGAVTLGACNPECTGFYTKKSVNATSALGPGNLGGPSGADTSCQTQFGAGWKALVVGGTRRATLTPFVGDGAQDWVLQKYTYYYNAQSQLIWRTDSVPLLGVSGGARQPLSASVYDTSSGIYAWSGWQMDWTTAPDLPASALGTCIGWTSASSLDWGQFVTADLTPANDGCATTYRILCVQQ